MDRAVKPRRSGKKGGTRQGPPTCRVPPGRQRRPRNADHPPTWTKGPRFSSSSCAQPWDSARPRTPSLGPPCPPPTTEPAPTRRCSGREQATCRAGSPARPRRWRGAAAGSRGKTPLSWAVQRPQWELRFPTVSRSRADPGTVDGKVPAGRGKLPGACRTRGARAPVRLGGRCANVGSRSGGLRVGSGGGGENAKLGQHPRAPLGERAGLRLARNP